MKSYVYLKEAIDDEVDNEEIVHNRSFGFSIASNY